MIRLDWFQRGRWVSCPIARLDSKVLSHPPPPGSGPPAENTTKHQLNTIRRLNGVFFRKKRARCGTLRVWEVDLPVD